MIELNSIFLARRILLIPSELSHPPESASRNFPSPLRCARRTKFSTSRFSWSRCAAVRSSAAASLLIDICQKKNNVNALKRFQLRFSQTEPGLECEKGRTSCHANNSWGDAAQTDNLPHLLQTDSLNVSITRCNKVRDYATCYTMREYSRC